MEEFKVVSMFSGAGGMDLGFIRAGFRVVFANDFDKYACQTYKKNIGGYIYSWDAKDFLEELSMLKRRAIDLLIGGPPCQGFSRAGKQNPLDDRIGHIQTFLGALRTLLPSAFVMENVYALVKSVKYQSLIQRLLIEIRELGYSVGCTLVNASEFNTPQNRKRVFLIGFLCEKPVTPALNKMLLPYQKKARSVRDSLTVLDRAGTGNNTSFTKAKIVLARKPSLGGNVYSSLLFSGFGRPINLSGYSPTITARGGNGLPIIDEHELYDNDVSWSKMYYTGLREGQVLPRVKEAPSYLRRITVEEAAVLQTFPLNYSFCGPTTAKIKQIGNAVPCKLAYSIARMVKGCLEKRKFDSYPTMERIQV